MMSEGFERSLLREDQRFGDAFLSIPVGRRRSFERIFRKDNRKSDMYMCTDVSDPVGDKVYYCCKPFSYQYHIICFKYVDDINADTTQ